MKQRLGYVLVLALAGGSVGISACSGDDTSGDEDTGGSAGASGSHAGSKTGGSSPGGMAGANSGGQGGGGSGGTPDEGGAAGMGGTPGVGGEAEGGMGGVSDGGATNNLAGAAGEAGAGGSGGPTLNYACGSDTLPKKLCSAFVGANCIDPTVCADCVMERATELADFLASFAEDNQCAACLDKYDAYFQCAIDAFESGNVTSGVECIEDYGADINFDNCGPLQGEANTCHTYLNEHECPATWPPT